jgi:hypothetical protein
LFVLPSRQGERLTALPKKVNGHHLRVELGHEHERPHEASAAAPVEQPPPPLCGFPACDRRQKRKARAPLCPEHMLAFAASAYYRRFDLLMRADCAERAIYALRDWIYEMQVIGNQRTRENT